MERLHTRRAMDFFSLYRNEDFLYKEKERIIIRWILTVVATTIFIFADDSANQTMVYISLGIIALYILINTIRFLKMDKDKEPSFTQGFLYSDILIVCLPLMVAPKVGAFIDPLLLFLVISAGLNYGHRAMIKCTTCVIALFTTAILVNPYWQQNLAITFSVFLMMLMVPFYLMSIMKTLEIDTYKLNEKAHKDALTGLYNRASINLKMEKALYNCKTNEQFCALFYFDLDNFKGVNDKLGHKVGDSLLVAVARTLKKEFRSNDLIFRLGGDEFFIIADGLTSKENAEAVGNKILKSVLTSAEKVAPGMGVSSSVGILFLESSDVDLTADIKTYISAADSAMYVAKKNGKNRLEFSNSICK